MRLASRGRAGDELLARFPVLGSALSKAVGGYLVSTNSIFLDNQLRHIPLFAELDPVELSEVANALHQLQANRGDVVFAEGQRGDAIYFIESGEVQLGTRVGDSYQMTFERMIAGDFFGELALLADSPVQVRRGLVTVGDRGEGGEDLACLFVRPRPGSDRARPP